MKYQIISDGSCDLYQSQIEQYEITVVPFYISWDDVHYQKEIVEADIREFYENMVTRKGEFPKSSLPSVQDYVDVFTDFVKDDIAVMCLTITPTLSGSFNSASNAREIVLETYPDAKIEVINTLATTVSQGLCVMEAAKMKQAGYSFEDNVRIMREQICPSSKIFFTVGDLSYLQNGGRISRMSGLIGSVLNLRPMIIEADGDISSQGVARSRKKSIQKTFDLFQNYLEESGDNPDDYQYCVGFGYDETEGEEYLRQLKEKFKELEISSVPSIGQIGATVSVHTGPYALGFGICKKYTSCS